MSDNKKTDSILFELLKDTRNDLKELQNDLQSMSECLKLHVKNFADHTKQDEHMYKEMSEIKYILRQNTDSLIEHMRRTELLEKQLIKYNDRVDEQDKKLESIEEPIKIRKALIKKILTITGLISAVGGAYLIIKSIFKL